MLDEGVMSKIDALEEHVNRVIKAESGAIAYDIDVVPIKVEPGHFSGENALKSRIIKILIDPEFVKKMPFDMVVSILLDIGRHEIGHWEYPRGSENGCPFDFYYGIEIYESTYQVLAEEKMGSLAGFVANAFTDIVNNINIENVLRSRGAHLSGIVYFYYDQGAWAKKYSMFYSFFVKLQERLWMTDEDRRMLKVFHHWEWKISRAVKSFMKKVGLGNDLTENALILLDKDKWSEYSKIFARHAVPFLKKPVVEILVGGESETSDSRFKYWIKDPSVLGKVIVRRVKSGKGNLSIVDKMTSIDLFYREIAKEIPIRVEGKTKMAEFKVVGFKRRDTEFFSRKLRINEKGDISFTEPRFYWSMMINAKDGISGTPNLYFILDTSGSMHESSGKSVLNLPWGMNSKYHYALLGIYGILNYLERNSIMPKKIALTTFSDDTRSIIVAPHKLKELKKMLFSPQFGNTLLNVNAVEDVLSKLGRSVVIMLSDGNIWNWNAIAYRLVNLFSRNYACYISIKEVTRADYDLKKVAAVFHISEIKNISGVMLDFTKKVYRKSVLVV